ncbi:hypothetical protein WJX82_000737 [Trebouxia sp. C0006]
MAVKFETGNLLGAIYALLVDIVVYARKAPSQEPATTGKGRKTLAARNPASQETARHGTEFNKEKALTARQTQGSQFCTTHVCSRQLDATVLKDHLEAVDRLIMEPFGLDAATTALFIKAGLWRLAPVGDFELERQPDRFLGSKGACQGCLAIAEALVSKSEQP